MSKFEEFSRKSLIDLVESIEISEAELYKIIDQKDAEIERIKFEINAFGGDLLICGATNLIMHKFKELVKELSEVESEP